MDKSIRQAALREGADFFSKVWGRLRPIASDFFVTNIILFLFFLTEYWVHLLKFEEWFNSTILRLHAGAIITAYARLLFFSVVEIFRFDRVDWRDISFFRPRQGPDNGTPPDNN